ncbi:MAG: S1C family serine protease [Eubacterium sp.]|jgi:serine protease Do
MLQDDEKFEYGGESFGSSETNAAGASGTDTQTLNETASYETADASVSTTDAQAPSIDAQVSSTEDQAASTDPQTSRSSVDPFKEEQFANKTRIFGGDAEAAAKSNFTDDSVKKAAQEYVVRTENGVSDELNTGAGNAADNTSTSFAGDTSGMNTGYGEMNTGVAPSGNYGSAGYGSAAGPGDSYGYGSENANGGTGAYGTFGADGTGGGGNFPPSGTVPGGYGAQNSPSGKAKKTKSPKYVTWRAFIIVLIICMIATSGLTIGGLKLFGDLGSTQSTTTSDSSKEVSATNYTLASSTRSDKSIQEIIALNENAVVEIRTESISTDSWMQNYVTEGAGSGVIIQSDGYIMTCNHVIEDASSITVALKDGTEYEATVVGTDDITDIAVLKISATGLTAVTYGNSDDIQVGDLAVAIGNPLGELGGTATAGIISALNREIEVDGKIMNLLQTDTSINPGNSGGGLFDGSGNLIGIVVAKSSGSEVEGLGFAIPINTAAPIASELIQNGKISGRAAIGVNVLDLTTAEKAMQYGVRTTGIYISEITSDEAKEAGFQVGDLIYYVEDTEITSAAVLRSTLLEYKPGDTIKVTVVRDNETVEIETTLVEAN